MSELIQANLGAPARELLSIVSVVVVRLTRAVFVDFGESIASAELILLGFPSSKGRTLRLASYTDGVATVRREAIRR